MKKLFLFFLLLLPSVASAQTYLSAQSHKQASATTQTITSDAAGTAVDTTGYSNTLLTVRGTYVVVTITFEASVDATNYFPIACNRVDSSVTETASGALTNTTRAWRCNTTGFTRFRTGSSTDWTSGTVNVTITPVAAAADLGVTVGQATAANLNATVTGTLAATQSGTWNVGTLTSLTNALPAGTNNIGDVDVLTVPADPFGVNADAASATGSISAKLRFIANTGIPITGTVTVGSHAVTNAGTFATQPASATTPVSTMNSASANSGLNSALAGVFDDTSPTSITENSFGFLRMSANRNLFGTIRDAAGNERGANVTASNELLVSVNNSSLTVAQATASSLNAQAVGNVAHDATESGNPLGVGATAETALSTATMVADGDRTRLYAGIDGVLITRPHSNLEDRVSGVVGITDGSSTSLIAAQGSGLRFCATMILVSNSSATNVTVDIRDGTAGTVLMTIPAAANMGGAVVPLATPLCTTANTIFAADPSASATTVTITAIGFKTKL